MKKQSLFIFLISAILCSCDIQSDHNGSEDKDDSQDPSTELPEYMVAPKLQLTPASVSAACAYAQSALELASSTDMDYTSGKIPSPLPADAEQVNKLWSALYGAVGQLDALLNQDWDEEYTPVLRFYRGLCFFELYYFWQNIPLWLSDRENLAEIPQALPQEALDMVMDDLFYVKHAASRCNPQVFEGDMDMYINAICGVILSIHRQRLADARVEFDTIIGSGHYQLPSDGGTSPQAGKLGSYIPAGASAYDDILLHSALIRFQMGHVADAIGFMNQLYIWNGKNPVMTLTLNEIKSFRRELKDCRSLGFWRSFQETDQELGIPSSAAFFPIPSEYLALNPNTRQNQGY